MLYQSLAKLDQEIILYMDNRQKTPGDILHPQTTVDEGYCMYDPVSKRYLFKPDRGSNGYGLYSAEHRALAQRRSESEILIKGRLVFIPEDNAS